MVLLENLEPYKDYYSYGKILDPESGKVYKCSVWVDNPDQLIVRGETQAPILLERKKKAHQEKKIKIKLRETAPADKTSASCC